MSYRALYRKYRPKGFSDIVGQQGIVQALTSQVATGRISHAYLFSGSRGTGKTSAAKVLARAINCQDNKGGEACGVCRACVELVGDTNMDIVEIDAASNNSVDRVREMIENVKYMPAVGKYRVYIVDEVHMLSASAFNALLKTLEEPPAHVVFILATTEPHKLPATVLSRCQQFQFRRISSADMTAMLEDVLKSEGATADREALQAIARASGGGMRDALSLLDQCLSLEGSHVTSRQVFQLLGTADSSCYFDVAECLLTGDAGAAVGLLDRFIGSGGDVKTFAVDLCRHMRDLFIASYVKDVADILDISGEDAALLREQAARHAPGDMLKCLSFLTELEGSLRYAANPRIPVELALFQCCRTEKENSYDALLARVERLEAELKNGVQKPAAVSQRPAKPPLPSPAVAEEKAPMPSEADVPWNEDAVTSGAGKAAFFDEEDAAPAEAQEASLPGQIDLFGGDGEPPAQASAAAPQAMAPGKLWNSALKALEKLPQIYAFASKGRASKYEQGALVITFTEDDKAAASMLEDERRWAKVGAAVDEAAGSHVEVALEVTKWSPAQQQFIDRSRAVIPKDATIIIEKE
jgi:DNA polymerase III subunit gamma/tau